MNIRGLLRKLNVEPAEEILKNPKMKQIVEFINKNDVIIYESDEVVNAKAFNTFLENINSIEAIINILNKPSIVSAINYYPEILAEFYNLYDFKKVTWYGKKSRILIDSQYLKVASKEWTEDVLFQSRKNIYLNNGKVTLREEKSEDVIPIEHNISVLARAKDEGVLFEVITKVTNAMKKVSE